MAKHSLDNFSRGVSNNPLVAAAVFRAIDWVMHNRMQEDYEQGPELPGPFH